MNRVFPHRRFVVVAVVVLAMAAGAALAANAPFLDLRRQAPVHGDAAAGAAKAGVCAACHGGNGVAVAPVFPNLAGQSTTYLYVQLRAFKVGARTSPVMQPLAAGLTDRDMRDLAAHFAALPGKRAIGETRKPSRGYALFHRGDAVHGIPPCQGCHGVDGKGPQPDPASTAPQPAWSTFPALAGQNAQYVLAQLQAFQNGTRAGTSNAKVMQGVAHTLSTEDMHAVADYVSNL